MSLKENQNNAENITPEDKPVSAKPKQEVVGNPTDSQSNIDQTQNHAEVVEPIIEQVEIPEVTEPMTETPIVKTTENSQTETEPISATTEIEQPQSIQQPQTQEIPPTSPQSQIPNSPTVNGQVKTVEKEISSQNLTTFENVPRSRTTHSASLRSRTTSSTFSIQNLLNKARVKIQERKRKKLDKIMSLFESNSEISNSDIQKLLRTTKRSATRYLNQLEKEQKITQVGVKGRSVKYIKKQ